MFRDTPVIREVLRIEQPSTRAATTAARSAVLRTFAILTIMPKRFGKVKVVSCEVKQKGRKSSKRWLSGNHDTTDYQESMIPFELVFTKGGKICGLLADWPLEDRERRALTVMLMVLFQTDSRQANKSVIFKEKEPGIYYAKATGRVQLRPRLCRGPARPNDEVTFLLRAEERDNETIPADAAKRAAVLMRAVRRDPSLRRRYRPAKRGMS